VEGRALASKQLLERLDETDAGALALVVEHLQYIPLGELPRVPDKARRDAPTIAVANLRSRDLSLSAPRIGLARA
jgi:hypothetical protein